MQSDKLTSDITNTIITIATSDITDFIEIGETTKLKPKNAIPPEKFTAIQSIKFGSDGSVKIKLHGKTRALRLISKYLDIISDSNIANKTKLNNIE